MSIKPILFYMKGCSSDGEEKNINIKNLGGGQFKPPWTAYPPPMYQLVSSFPTLKTSLQGLSCDLNPILFYIKVVQMMVKKRKSTSKT